MVFEVQVRMYHAHQTHFTAKLWSEHMYLEEQQHEECYVQMIFTATNEILWEVTLTNLRGYLFENLVEKQRGIFTKAESTWEEFIKI
jgi:hypothetical protein